MEWYKKVLTQYADFEGRARRKEYWMFNLINYLIMMGVMLLLIPVIITEGQNTIATILGVIGGIALLLYTFGVFVPSIAVTARRLHDTGRSGWWMLISLVPYIGSFVLLFFSVKDSDAGVNQYGPNPKGIGNGPIEIEI